MTMVIRALALSLLVILNSIFLPSSSFAGGECPIDAGGNQVQLCIGNTIEGGGPAGGGGPLRFGIRAMLEVIWEID